MLSAPEVTMRDTGNLTRPKTEDFGATQRAKAANKRGKMKNMGSPKGRNTYGDGISVVGGILNKMPTVGWYPRSRRGIGLRHYASRATIIGEMPSGKLITHKQVNRENSEHINDKLIHLIADPNTLTLAYELIKSNPGNMTRGASSETLDGIDKNWIEQTSMKLRAGKFEFSSMRRVYIGKPDGSRRPLTISPPRDKVVQKAIQLVLEPIYEPHFLENSHGFRPNKGCHTALEKVKNWFHGVPWVIETDIQKCYDTIDHRVLITILKKRVRCIKTLTLIKKGLECGAVDLKTFVETKLGTPQGSILSPLLCNIYLHELDKEMYKLKKQYSSPANYQRRKNPEYRRIQYLKERTKDTGELRGLAILQRKIHSKDPMDGRFRKLFYIRYADDIIIGVTGGYEDAEKIKTHVQNFLDKELKLELKAQKTKIVSFKKSEIKFLGAKIYGQQRNEKPCKLVKKVSWENARKVRQTPRVGLRAPIKELMIKLAGNGFIKKDKDGRYVGTGLKRMVNLDHADIIGYYNSVIYGILNFYSFADNYTRVGALIKFQMRHSCALTLALKFKLRHRAKAFKKFGKSLKCPETNRELAIPKSFKRSGKFLTKTPSIDETIAKRWNRKLTRSNLHKACVICGTVPAEMHHIRQVKDLKQKHKKKQLDFFTMQMAGINRKQVPLCKEHHQRLHRKELSTEERHAFAEGVQKLYRKV